MGNIYKKHLDWLITMARQPGFKAHAWHRAQQLDADKSGIWTGIAKELIKEINGQAKDGESAHQPMMKRR